jgi:hypothetical protein
MNQHKVGTPKRYGKGVSDDDAAAGRRTFRLETNAELYEGVRFGFIEVAAPTEGSSGEAAPIPFTIDGIRLVVQTKAVNYTGHFTSPTDSMLEKVWWTAAWTVRSNLLKDHFGSILMDRGDRTAW